ncbi:hypothetical protein EJ997_05825 [Flaviflexus ciconiae]|uniref:Uncharacterized protein n=1 Tax=Flaviflexus ciconiae TaxID=2496867 RepID=A0A3S9PX70_9ACTO|nr:hypothetical protein [Flaviflexus ciconiae]AZQ76925.1 hypothetical protein EJ997_05825 [Flaviflexus ciconiae]
MVDDDGDNSECSQAVKAADNAPGSAIGWRPRRLLGADVSAVLMITSFRILSATLVANCQRVALYSPNLMKYQTGGDVQD